MISIVGLSTLQLDELLERLVAHIVRTSYADTGAILLLDEDDETLRPGTYIGIDEADTRGLRIPLGQGFAGRVAKERQTVVLADAAHDPKIINQGFRHKGVRWLVGVPLLIGDQLVGVAHIGRRGDNPFSIREIRTSK